jgi:hypothetical protein
MVGWGFWGGPPPSPPPPPLLLPLRLIKRAKHVWCERLLPRAPPPVPPPTAAPLSVLQVWWRSVYSALRTKRLEADLAAIELEEAAVRHLSAFKIQGMVRVRAAQDALAVLRRRARGADRRVSSVGTAPLSSPPSAAAATSAASTAAVPAPAPAGGPTSPAAAPPTAAPAASPLASSRTPAPAPAPVAAAKCCCVVM